jgi:hypothetical protein
MNITVCTSNGREDMTAGEYRRRHREAGEWLAKQLRHHDWTRHGHGANYRALAGEAALKFGLDENWWSVSNPIVRAEP